jgi:hypothetical protein
MTFLPWQRGVPRSNTTTSDEFPQGLVIPTVWSKRGRATQEAVHCYVQAPSTDNGIDFVYRVQAQYPWLVTSITPAIVSSAISEGRP